ncbi:MAG TPA: hypothetical protein PLO71_01085, partial [Thauera phenylacetica]|nr:hypothetical protein [Thauera phenylacetica]
MAEDPVRRETVAEAVLERLHIVDALADEGAFAEQVLIYVRHRPRVRIDARLAAIQACIDGSTGTGQADRHRRLQNAVAVGDAAHRRIVARAVQRVRHGRDQRPRGIARQLGVGVEGDDELHRGQGRGITDHAGETRSGGGGDAAQQRIELRELAALALMPHPHALLRVPAPRAMEEEEDVAFGAGSAITIFAIERRDRKACALDQRSIGRQGLLARVEQVGEQAKMQTAVAIGQEADFERLDEFIDVVGTGEQGRHHHQRAPLRRDARGEVHARQRVRRRHQSGEPVHQGNAQPARGQQCKEGGYQQHPGALAVRRKSGVQGPEQPSGDGHGQQRDGAQIERQRARRRPRAQRCAPGGTKGHRALERRPALVDEVEAYMVGATCRAPARP